MENKYHLHNFMTNEPNAFKEMCEWVIKDLPPFIEEVSPGYFKIDSGDGMIIYTGREGAKEFSKTLEKAAKKFINNEK